MTPYRALVAAALLTPLISACGTTDEAADDAPAGDAEVPALTREEIQERAEAMSPEMAESLGIVDTTIRIERPVPAESTIILPAVPDSAPRR